MYYLNVILKILMSYSSYTYIFPQGSVCDKNLSYFNINYQQIFFILTTFCANLENCNTTLISFILELETAFSINLIREILHGINIHNWRLYRRRLSILRRERIANYILIVASITFKKSEKKKKQKSAKLKSRI